MPRSTKGRVKKGKATSSKRPNRQPTSLAKYLQQTSKRRPKSSAMDREDVHDDIRAFLEARAAGETDIPLAQYWEEHLKPTYDLPHKSVSSLQTYIGANFRELWGRCQ
jgi:hypothetical protein